MSRSSPTSPNVAPLATVHPFRASATDEADDDALLAALREGKPRAHAAFFDRYASHVERTVVRILGLDTDVAALVNDVFLRAMQRIDRVVDGEGLRPWLTQIAVFCAREQVRARRRRRWLRFFASDDVPEIEAPVAPPEMREAVRRLYRVLDAMATDDRVAFTLRCIEGMELVEVADACGVSLATAKRRIARAEKRFVALGRRDPLLASWLEGGVRWSDR